MIGQIFWLRLPAPPECWHCGVMQEFDVAVTPNRLVCHPDVDCRLLNASFFGAKFAIPGCNDIVKDRP
jgi:hypothetical protein